MFPAVVVPVGFEDCVATVITPLWDTCSKLWLEALLTCNGTWAEDVTSTPLDDTFNDVFALFIKKKSVVVAVILFPLWNNKLLVKLLGEFHNVI